MDDNSVYREVFFEETDTYLRALNDDVLQLEENPEDIELLNAIFRSAHTLKGMAATMGYEKMAKLTHQLENLFELLKNRELSANHEIISLIFNCLDKLSDIVEDLRDGGDGEIDVTSLVDALKNVEQADAKGNDDAAEKDNEENAALVPALKNYTMAHVRDVEEGISLGYQGFVVAFRLAEDTPMKGVRSFLILNELNTMGQVLLTEPADEAMESEDFNGLINALILTKQSAAEVQEFIANESDVAEVAVIEAKSVLTEPVDQKKPEQKASVKEKSARDKTKTKPTQKRQTIRVDLSRLDQFMNLVSELVIHRSRLETITDGYNIPEVHEPLEQVERITSELQDVVLQLRMQPFKVAVQRFPRMIRDLGDELSKDLRLVTEGEETELDRTVVTELGEPLVHLLRNAADHGIEEPEVREKAGKPRQGIITVGAYPEGNRVVVTVSDDGKGIDPAVIEESAQSKGIETVGLTENEIIQLIFHPGFSTKKEVTGVSGRGVGMDVVKEKINSLNGTIEVESIVGKGSTFRITLPLTLSIIQSLLVQAGPDTFAIPQSIIEKVEEYKQASITTVHQAEVYRYHDELIPVVYLSEALGFEKNLAVEPYVVIVTDHNQLYAVVIDALIGQNEIVIKDLGAEIKDMKQYLGATILGNGEVILILDLSAIIAAERGKVYEASER